MAANTYRIKEKNQKTKEIFFYTNLIVLPLALCVDFNTGLSLSLITNTALMYVLHEIGKQRRPGSNAINRIQGFFAGSQRQAELEVDNAHRNVINGGAYLYDLVLR